MDKIEKEIQEIIDRETRAWDTQDADLLMTIWHPDMIWPWPPHNGAHDPAQWLLEWGRYDYRRWRNGWQELFDTHTLVHNRRKTVKITVTEQGDGAFAVVDVDTLWRDRHGKDFHWQGRAGKGYSLVNGEWKLIYHTGLLEY
ncbi:MAG: hypothetical protein ABIA75_02655 [Candidatus Neomarinimicrobiota bacterium]